MALVEKDFHHPYTPYEIQYALMKAIYDCITERQIGIFESPTGTGKSLSIICGSLTWLRDFQSQRIDDETEEKKDGDEPGWVLEHAKREKRQALVEQRAEQETKLKNIREQELRQKQRHETDQSRSKRRRIADSPGCAKADDDSRFLLDDYESEEETPHAKNASTAPRGDGLSSRSLQLMERLGEMIPALSKDELQPEDEVKIFYCSRTHSQLTQFVHELRRVEFPSPWTDMGSTYASDQVSQVVIKHLPLASRKNLCINPKVAKLGNAPAINERCLELQQPEIPKDHKCPFVPNKENEALVNDFRDHTLASIRDIEDLGTLGKSIGICPYYAARPSIKVSEIITLPYPLLLQKSAREALGISLKDHVLVVDEAHNLMDAIANINAISVTHHQLRRSRTLLNVYLQRFRNRLKGKNRMYVVQVVRVLDSINGYLDQKVTDSRVTDGIAQVGDLMAGKGVDQINLYKLLRYLNESKLARKVENYAQHVDEENSSVASEPHKSLAPALTVVQSFLAALTNPSSEGCVFYERSEDNSVSLKYMLLDPSPHFQELVEDARAVILAGGTMSPMNDYIRHLFPYLNAERLKTWSCGHIIPKDNLVVWPVAKAPSGIDFDFTFDKRTSPTMIDALGNCLSDLCASIPDGVVVFFPSYRYMDEVILRWKRDHSAATGGTSWSQIAKQKPIFQEFKDSPGDENILHEYSSSIEEGKGGLLLSVIGGKMSEGINFSDQLGRGVVVVGLPFPNIQSAQWKAKLAYIEKITVARGGSRDDGKLTARDFYENACMRAVNQSIGRAIRHQKDYASIVLLDRRYRTPRIQSKLPSWIRQGLVLGKGEASWTSVTGSLADFFRCKSLC